MRRAIKTLGLFLSAIFMLAGCSSSEDEDLIIISDGPSWNFPEVKDYNIVEENLSKPPYSDGFTKNSIHQIPLSQLPNWVSYLANSIGNAIIYRTSVYGEYVYNINNMISSSNGYFYDSKGYLIGNSHSFLSQNHEWELICITKPDIIEDYNAMKDMFHDTTNPLLGKWALVKTSSELQYWEFRSDGTGFTYYLYNGEIREKLPFLYSAEEINLSEGRKWIGLKLAFETEKMTHKVYYEFDSDNNLFSVFSHDHKLQRCID